MSVVSGALNSNSSSKASQRQQQTARETAQLQYDMWQEQVEMFQPFLDAGNFGIENFQSMMSSDQRANMSQRAQDIQDFELSSTPRADFTVNPITGRIQYSDPQTQASRQTPTGDFGRAPWEGGSPGKTWGGPRPGGPDGLMGMPSDMGSGNFTQSPTEPNRRYSGNTVPVPAGSPIREGGVQVGTNESPIYPQSGPYSLANMPGGQRSNSQQNLSEGGALLPSLPDLPGTVDFEFDEDDPVYKFKQEQLNEQVERKLASLGMSDSRAGVDAVAEANMGLISNETDKQYNRLRGERDYLAQRASDLYGMGEKRGNTLYDRIYGQQNDLYNRVYGQGTSEDARRFALLGDKYGAASGEYGTDYQGYLDLTKIGTGASHSAGQGALSTGRGMSDSMMQGANAYAQNQLMQGRIWSDQIGGMTNALMNTDWSQYGNNNTGGGNTSYYGGGGGFNSYINDSSNYGSGSIL